MEGILMAYPWGFKNWATVQVSRVFLPYPKVVLHCTLFINAMGWLHCIAILSLAPFCFNGECKGHSPHFLSLALEFFVSRLWYQDSFHFRFACSCHVDLQCNELIQSSLPLFFWKSPTEMKIELHVTETRQISAVFLEYMTQYKINTASKQIGFKCLFLITWKNKVILRIIENQLDYMCIFCRLLLAHQPVWLQVAKYGHFGAALISSMNWVETTDLISCRAQGEEISAHQSKRNQNTELKNKTPW